MEASREHPKLGTALLWPRRVRKFRWHKACGEKNAGTGLIPLCIWGPQCPLCHQSSPPVIAPHSLLPRVSSLRLTWRVSREPRVWLVQRVVASTCPSPPAGNLPHFAGTTLHTAGCQPPTPSSPLTAGNIKVSGQLPDASRPTSISTGSSHWLLGNCGFFPLLHCHPSPVGALIPAHPDKPL